MAAANAVIANIFKGEENAKNFITPELLATFQMWKQESAVINSERFKIETDCTKLTKKEFT